ncbi:mucin-associated surface protein (MASP), partial [Trypanosoma cruzi]
VCLCACSAIAPIPTASCCAAAAAVCYFGCEWLCDLSLVLFSLSVDGELVCAEGYTQVTGVMMTGRVLLVCALCVLWCGAAVGVRRRRDLLPVVKVRWRLLELQRQDKTAQI